ncbi:Vacuolar protein-sorting-associated protein 28 [Blastocladiella emersonii ATCC 22665]|nr:Vacuolar protein-sorting-associated protein 28 [Blastocladiella emersonii ATCC 22665]
MNPYASQGSLATTGPTAAAGSAPVRLWASNAEREQVENLADLFAIIVTVDRLEKQYIRDNISPAEYTPACTKLIAQFKTALNLVHDQVPSVEAFIKEYGLNCPLAVNRLLKIGVPATVEHSNPTREAGNSAKSVAETVQHFITLMDSVKLGMVAVDQLHPLLSDLMSSMNNIPREFDGKAKIKSWLITLNQMKASDMLSEDQARQLHFDLESAHTEFYRSLQ